MFEYYNIDTRLALPQRGMFPYDVLYLFDNSNTYIHFLHT